MKRVYANEEICMGCGLCRVYCQLEHSKTKDLIKAFKKEKYPSVPALRRAVVRLLLSYGGYAKRPDYRYSECGHAKVHGLLDLHTGLS